jgi:hypothetical protein
MHATIVKFDVAYHCIACLLQIQEGSVYIAERRGIGLQHRDRLGDWCQDFDEYIELVPVRCALNRVTNCLCALSGVIPMCTVDG